MEELKGAVLVAFGVLGEAVPETLITADLLTPPKAAVRITHPVKVGLTE